MRQLLYIAFLLVSLSSCKEDPPKQVLQTNFSNGILCLNEGLFQQNNASLSYYDHDSSKTSHHLFSEINGRGLGDTANDIIYFNYAGKGYYAIAVDVSSQIEIIDAITLKSIKQIALFNDNVPRSPRSLLFQDGFLYSINFDGTVTVISVPGLAISKTITVGLNPEQAVISGNELFCVNSGGLNFPDYDNTISVVDLTDHTLKHTFTTAINGGTIIRDAQNDLYMISRGNYADISPNLLRIDPATYSVESSFDIGIISMDYLDNFIYYYDEDEQGIYRINTTTETIETNQLIDCSDFQNFYGIYIHPQTKDIYLVDANDYLTSSTIKCYSNTGEFKNEFNTGLNTGKILFTQ